MDQLKKDRAIVQEQIRQISNINARLQEEVSEEKMLIERFENQIAEQRRVNFGRNDDNLDLLAQSDALENHIRLLYEQNKMIEGEIDKFIMDDDAVARKLENRRSVSPDRHSLSPCTKSHIASPPKQPVPVYEKAEKPFGPDGSFGMRDSGVSTHHGTAHRQRTGDGHSSPLGRSTGQGNAACSKNAGALLDGGFDSSFGRSRRQVHHAESNIQNAQRYQALRDRSDSPTGHLQASHASRKQPAVSFYSERDNKYKRSNREPYQSDLKTGYG